MAIIKKSTIDSQEIKKDFSPVIDVENEEGMERMSFNKEEYLSVLENARKEGYQAGFNEGKNDGYSEGIALIEKERKDFENAISKEKENLNTYLKQESIKYIDTFKSDIYSLVYNSINKIFFNAISDNEMMTTYMHNLLSHLCEKYKGFEIFCNEYTSNLIEILNFPEDSFTKIVDESYKNFDIKIVSDSENIEFLLKDELLKLEELFN